MDKNIILMFILVKKNCLFSKSKWHIISFVRAISRLASGILFRTNGNKLNYKIITDSKIFQ